MFLALLVLLVDPTLVKRDPTKSYLEVKASPTIAMAYWNRPALVTVVAEIKGPETEEFYCPEVSFIQSYGTSHPQASIEESDCVPFEERNVVPPAPEECQARIVGGKYIPSKQDDFCLPQAPGFRRKWGRIYAYDSCQTEDICTIEIVVVMKKAERTVAQGSVRFMVR